MEKRGSVELTVKFIVELIIYSIIVFMLFYIFFRWLSGG
jgi:hypothetical protein